ncbi:S8 family serine peptidase [Roseovarius sp. 2305UL8-3]|uniref:S8 family serine peptidase n=1 Tax=Roseovarius conchicola TaxID=3121636 RepID=UPI003528C38D
MACRVLARWGVAAVVLISLAFPASDAAVGKGLFFSAAWADGDGGDGDGGDGDDGGDDRDDRDDRGSRNGTNSRAQGGSGFEFRFPWKERSQKTRRTQRTAQTAPPIVRLEQAPAELVVSDIANEDLDVLLEEGYAVIQVLQLAELDHALTRLTIPSGTGLEDARDRVRALTTGQTADFNHYYRFEQSETLAAVQAQPCTHENCRAWELIEWPHNALALGECALTVPVGMVDTGINPEHEIMAAARLETITLTDMALSPSKAIHGTAVASLLVGDTNSRVPGLISDADLIAVDAFASAGHEERADLVSLLRALDLLANREVRVINLSLSGPDNRLLAEAVEEMAEERSIIIVSAVGNAGPRAKPSFPAAYENVLAVTAVDAKGRIYRHAQRGAHVDVAAPGVNMLAATSIRGARLKSGTSFAVPFVTAAAGLIVSQNPSLNIQGLRQRLGETALDLGAEGKDDIFGYGLISTSGVCAPPLVD